MGGNDLPQAELKIPSSFSSDGVFIANLDNAYVYLGLHDILWPSLTVKKVRAVSMVAGELHMNEMRRSKDIGLLKLEHQIAYDNFIQGICLPDENEMTPSPNSMCLVAG